MKQTGFGGSILSEEKKALNEDIKSLTNDPQARSSVTYHYKESESIDYDTGTVLEMGGGNPTVYGLIQSISRKEMADLNIPESSQILLIAKEYLDDEGIVPELWEYLTIDSVDYDIVSHDLPVPGLHYRFIINQRGQE